MENRYTINSQRWLYFFLAAHLLLWTLVPVLVRHNLPLDAIEGTIWGHQLEWGYDKNPWLNGWLTALAMTLDHYSGWMIYFFSQLSVVACMWSMWMLGKKILPPLYAMIAVMLLECIQYFNFHAIDFNDNTLELGLWGLSIYVFYLALRSNKIIPWILTGLFTALALMAKYYTLALLAGFFLFLILHAKNRRLLTTLPPYAGFGMFLLVCTPHIMWLFFHDFITIQYVFDRASNLPDWKNHFIYPAQFFWQQFLTFLPALIPCILLLAGKKPALASERLTINSFDKLFLFYTACMPLLLTLLLCLTLGITLRAGWGMPLLSAWGIILVAILQPNITRARIIAFLIFIFSFLAAEVSGYSYALIFSSSTTSANFPGKEIAAMITREWHEKYHTRLDYVGGSRWIGGNIEFYSPDHPAVFIELDKQRAPWINTHDMKKKGAVLVWEMSQDNDLPEVTKQKFRSYKNMEVKTFTWQRDQGKLPPIKIGVVVLPPEQLSS